MKQFNAKSLLALSLMAAFCLTMPRSTKAAFNFIVHTDGQYTFSGTPPLIFLFASETATSSTPFALDSVVVAHVINFSVAPPSIQDGVFTFTAASGDKLSGTFTGTVDEVGPIIDVYSGPFQFTGGTGLFQGVTGGGTYTGQAQNTSSTGGVSSMDWTGQITVVPEPGSLTLMLSGALMGSAVLIRRRVRL